MGLTEPQHGMILWMAASTVILLAIGAGIGILLYRLLKNKNKTGSAGS